MTTRGKLAHEYVELLGGWICIAYDDDAFGSDSVLSKYGEGRNSLEADADYYAKYCDITSLPEVSQ